LIEAARASHRARSTKPAARAQLTGTRSPA